MKQTFEVHLRPCPLHLWGVARDTELGPIAFCDDCGIPVMRFDTDPDSLPEEACKVALAVMGEDGEGMGPEEILAGLGLTEAEVTSLGTARGFDGTMGITVWAFLLERRPLTPEEFDTVNEQRRILIGGHDLNLMVESITGGGHHFSEN
jgi:hypothetical protein